LFGINEGFQFTNYVAPSGKYGKHVDRCVDMPVRKLSISIQLTNPEKYKGGELYLYDDGFESEYDFYVDFSLNYQFKFLKLNG
jgi:predicted 2-oxoglutarate/Fe(II)-dependent dioxygenase YbiX